MTVGLEVTDQGRALSFGLEDLMRYTPFGGPGARARATRTPADEVRFPAVKAAAAAQMPARPADVVEVLAIDFDAFA